MLEERPGNSPYQYQALLRVLAAISRGHFSFRDWLTARNPYFKLPVKIRWQLSCTGFGLS